jgi:hypothetical protein
MTSPRIWNGWLIRVCREYVVSRVDLQLKHRAQPARAKPAGSLIKGTDQKARTYYKELKVAISWRPVAKNWATLASVQPDPAQLWPVSQLRIRVRPEFSLLAPEANNLGPVRFTGILKEFHRPDFLWKDFLWDRSNRRNVLELFHRNVFLSCTFQRKLVKEHVHMHVFLQWPNYKTI